MIQLKLNPRYEAIFKVKHIFPHPSSILPLSVEADFIKEVLDVGLYKQTTRITSSISPQTSAFVHRTMAFLHT